jgi:hypothetical protein
MSVHRECSVCNVALQCGVSNVAFAMWRGNEALAAAGMHRWSAILNCTRDCAHGSWLMPLAGWNYPRITEKWPTQWDLGFFKNSSRLPLSIWSF